MTKISEKTKSNSTIEEKPKGKIRSFFIRLGGSMMVPVAILAFGVFLSGIASTFAHIESVSILYDILIAISDFVIKNFGFIVCLSVANSFSKDNGSVVLIAALIWFTSFIIQPLFIETNIDGTYNIWFYKNLTPTIFIDQFGFLSLNTSIFGGIFIAFFSVFLFDKTHKKMLIKPLMFFGGVKFSLILSLISGPLIGMFFLILWPALGIGIELMGIGLLTLPYGFDVFFYGFFNRLLVPFGLHTILIPIFNASSVSGVLTSNIGGVESVIATGDYFIWHKAYEIGIPFSIIREGGSFIFDGVNYTVSNNVNPGQFTQGFYPIILFAFPLAGLAMTLRSKNKHRWSLIFLVSFIPLLTGVTEPFEFLFVFSSFKLYIFHAFFTGLSFLSMDLFNVSMGMSIGWIVDVFLFGLIPQIQGNITNVQIMPIIGICTGISYFLAFYFIKQKNNTMLKI